MSYLVTNQSVENQPAISNRQLSHKWTKGHSIEGEIIFMLTTKLFKSIYILLKIYMRTVTIAFSISFHTNYTKIGSRGASKWNLNRNEQLSSQSKDYFTLYQMALCPLMTKLSI